MRDWLRLLRPEVVLSAASGGLTVMLLAEAAGAAGPPEDALVRSLAAGLGAESFRLVWAGAVAVACGGLAVHAVTLHDLLELGRDRALSIERPLAHRRLPRSSVTAVCMLGLLSGLAASAAMGPVSGALGIAAAGSALAFNLTLRRLPALAVGLHGMSRCLTMILAAPQLGFLWPLWLAMSHVMICDAALRPASRGRLVADAGLFRLAGAWALMSLAMLTWMRAVGGRWFPGAPDIWLPPALAAAGGVGLLLVLARRSAIELAGRIRLRPRARRRLTVAASFWLMVYDAAWLLGAGLPLAAVAPLGFILLAALMRLGADLGPAGPRPGERLILGSAAAADPRPAGEPEA